jgi:hypothetical protein
MEVWEKIKTEATDNILDATVVTAALKAKGCFKNQVGGRMITERIKYATPTASVTGVAKGDVLGTGETETETEARWPMRMLAQHVQRSVDDDLACAGEHRIVDYVKKRLEEARESIAQVLETDLFRAADSTEAAHKHPQSLNDMVPAYADRATGTYGLIARSNSWWQCQYKAFTLPKEVELVNDMRNLWNTCGANLSYPDLLLTNQAIFEMYEMFGLDQTQIVKGTSGGLVDLGFQTIKFKGADLTWVGSSLISTDTIFMLNTRFIQYVKDPNGWFEMTPWKYIPTQLESLAHIVARGNLICTQPRRQGLLYTA